MSGKTVWALVVVAALVAVIYFAASRRSAAADLSGTWEGKTGEGKPISFTVVNNKLATFKFGYTRKPTGQAIGGIQSGYETTYGRHETVLTSDEQAGRVKVKYTFEGKSTRDKDEGTYQEEHEPPFKPLEDSFTLRSPDPKEFAYVLEVQAGTSLSGTLGVGSGDPQPVKWTARRK